MDSPVDLTNLREMTDNDTEMEKELFDEFCSSFESGLARLLESTEEAAFETWRKEAHALKGIALNLGAMKLAEFCKSAQDNSSCDVDAKRAMLQNIQAEYEQVKVFLQEIH